LPLGYLAQTRVVLAWGTYPSWKDIDDAADKTHHLLGWSKPGTHRSETGVFTLNHARIFLEMQAVPISWGGSTGKDLVHESMGHS
jgi:hypothetical protein